MRKRRAHSRASTGSSIAAQIPIDAIATADARHYRNPILAGFYPDPSIDARRRGLLPRQFDASRTSPASRCSTAAISSPGRRSAMPSTGRASSTSGRSACRAASSRPTITYHDGIFYIVNTCVDCGGNFVFTATHPAGPWSDPVWLSISSGIDPSLFFDDDGKRLDPQQRPAGRHAALRRASRDLDPGVRRARTASRSARARCWSTAASISPTKPIWIEGPHIFRRTAGIT